MRFKSSESILDFGEPHQQTPNGAARVRLEVYEKFTTGRLHDSDCRSGDKEGCCELHFRWFTFMNYEFLIIGPVYFIYE